MPEPTLIRSADDLDSAFEASRERPVFLFKHSLTCPISSNAHAEYQRFVAGRDDAEEALYALLEIQKSRDLSRDVAERTGVRHESPQVILLKDGQQVWNASHWKIKREALEQALTANA